MPLKLARTAIVTLPYFKAVIPHSQKHSGGIVSLFVPTQSVFKDCHVVTENLSSDVRQDIRRLLMTTVR